MLAEAERGMPGLRVWGLCWRTSFALLLGFLPLLSNSEGSLLSVTDALKVSLAFGTRSRSGIKE